MERFWHFVSPLVSKDTLMYKSSKDKMTLLFVLQLQRTSLFCIVDLCFFLICFVVIILCTFSILLSM